MSDLDYLKILKFHSVLPYSTGDLDKKLTCQNTCIFKNNVTEVTVLMGNVSWINSRTLISLFSTFRITFMVISFL